MIRKYTEKPVVIEAIHYDPDNLGDVKEFLGDKWVRYDNGRPGQFLIEAPEGYIMTYLGDYIVKGAEGEFYPVSYDDFESTHDVVGD